MSYRFLLYFIELYDALNSANALRWKISHISPILAIIIHQIFSLARDWSKRVTWHNMPQPKLGNIRVIFPNPSDIPQFSKLARDCAKNIWRIINTVVSICLQKYARIFVLGHYLFLEAHSFPRASLSENCSLLGTDNVRGQMSVHIFAPNGDYCLYIQMR